MQCQSTARDGLWVISLTIQDCWLVVVQPSNSAVSKRSTVYTFDKPASSKTAGVKTIAGKQQCSVSTQQGTVSHDKPATSRMAGV